MHDDLPVVERQAVMSALAMVVDPCSIATGVPISLVDMGMIRDVDIAHHHVSITLCLTSPLCLHVGLILAQVEERVAGIPGVTHVECHIDPAAEWLPSMMNAGMTARLRRLRPLIR